MKRQESSSQAVNSQLEAREEAEKLETEEADAETFSSASAPSGRNAALSAAILRVLEVAINNNDYCEVFTIAIMKIF